MAYPLPRRITHSLARRTSAPGNKTQTQPPPPPLPPSLSSPPTLRVPCFSRLLLRLAGGPGRTARRRLPGYLCACARASAAPRGRRPIRPRAATHGGHSGSESEGAAHAAAPHQAVGAAAASASWPPRAYPAGCLGSHRRQPRSAPFFDVPPTRWGRRRRRGALRRRARGSPGEAHGPPPWGRRPPSPATGEAPAVAGARPSGSATGGRRGRGRQHAVDPQRAEASSIIIPRQHGGGGVSRDAVVDDRGSGYGSGRRHAGSVRCGARGGGDRGGRLRPDGRQATAAASEAVARRATAARFAVPGALADRDHRRRVPGPRRLARREPAIISAAGQRYHSTGHTLDHQEKIVTRFS